MCGAIPPLPNTPSWRGAQLKHRDFTFTLPLEKIVTWDLMVICIARDKNGNMSLCSFVVFHMSLALNFICCRYADLWILAKLLSLHNT
jgi:hypothetical protein